MSEKTVSPPAFGSIVADAARAVASLDRIAPAFEEAAALVVGALRDGDGHEGHDQGQREREERPGAARMVE